MEIDKVRVNVYDALFSHEANLLLLFYTAEELQYLEEDCIIDEIEEEKRKDKEICKTFITNAGTIIETLSKIEANRLKYDEIMNDMYGVSSIRDEGCHHGECR